MFKTLDILFAINMQEISAPSFLTVKQKQFWGHLLRHCFLLTHESIKNCGRYKKVSTTNSNTYFTLNVNKV